MCLSALTGSIAPRLPDNLSDFLGNEILWITAGDNQVPQLRGRDLKLCHGVYVYASARILVQVTNRARAMVHHDLAQRPHRRRLPAGAVRNHYVSQIEQLSPPVPVWQA